MQDINQNNKDNYKSSFWSALYNEIVLSDGAGKVARVGFLCSPRLVIYP